MADSPSAQAGGTVAAPLASTITPRPVVIPTSAFVSPAEVVDALAAERNLRPLFLIRNRLEDRGLWERFSAILVSMPDKLLTVLSTTTPGRVDVTNADVIALIVAAGGDPAEILA